MLRRKPLSIFLGAIAVICAPMPSNIARAQAPLNEEVEVRLALSACPAGIAKGAAVYVLRKQGYVKVRESQNGFTAIVQHAVPGSQEPRCMDVEGTRTVLPRILKVAELRSAGKSPGEIRAYVAEAFAKGVFRAPARPAIEYMLSTEIMTQNAKGVVEHFPPHVMFYAPYLTNADIGVDGSLAEDGNPAGVAFVVLEGTPQAMIIVPVNTTSRFEPHIHNQ